VEPILFDDITLSGIEVLVGEELAAEIPGPLEALQPVTCRTDLGLAYRFLVRRIFDNEIPPLLHHDTITNLFEGPLVNSGDFKKVVDLFEGRPLPAPDDLFCQCPVDAGKANQLLFSSGIKR
jgi:hypothetical protein